MRRCSIAVAMRKYLNAFAVLLLLSFVVTYRHDVLHPAQQHWFSRYASLAYDLLGWPQGITAWALFLTLFAIAEQTRETGKSAFATEAAARASLEQTRLTRVTVNAQYRPRVLIKSIRVVETDDDINLRIIYVNKGDTVANVIDGEVTLSWVWPLIRDETHHVTTTITAFKLGPGLSEPLLISLKEGWVLYRMAANKSDDGKAAQTLRCRGSVRYKDGNEATRETAFDRELNFSTGRFVPSTNPEDEYSD